MNDINDKNSFADKLIKQLKNSDKKIFKEEFEEYLPAKIYDFHSHIWKKDFLKNTITESRKKQNPFLDDEVIDGFTFNDFKIVYNKLFPGKEVRGLFFGLPMKEFDLEKTNNFISDLCIKTRSYGLYIPEPDLDNIPEDFFKKRFIGFKPYPDLVEFEVPEDFSKLDINVSNFDFISKKVLEFSNKYSLILLIHLPRKDRLNDPENIDEISEIARKYKNIKIILAHAGRSYSYADIKNSIYSIKNIKNIYVDTAMINNFMVNKIILRELGPDRVLFGSDSAISFLKGKNIEINNKHYFVTEKPKIWSLSTNEMNLDFTFFIYEIIRAIKLATDELGLVKSDIEKIFFLNAIKIINDITERIV